MPVVDSPKQRKRSVSLARFVFFRFAVVLLATMGALFWAVWKLDAQLQADTAKVSLRRSVRDLADAAKAATEDAKLALLDIRKKLQDDPAILSERTRLDEFLRGSIHVDQGKVGALICTASAVLGAAGRVPGTADGWQESRWYTRALQRFHAGRSGGSRDNPPFSWETFEVEAEHYSVLSIAFQLSGGAPCIVSLVLDSHMVTLGSNPDLVRSDEVFVVLWPDGTLLGASGNLRNEGAAGAVSHLPAFESHPLGLGLARWRTDKEARARSFALDFPAGPWWFQFTTIPVDPGQDLWIGFALPQNALPGIGEQVLAASVWIGGLGLLFLLLTSVSVARKVAVPIHAFMQRARNVGPFDRDHGYWPKTRVRELGDLIDAMDSLSSLARNAGLDRDVQEERVEDAYPAAKDSGEHTQTERAAAAKEVSPPVDREEVMRMLSQKRNLARELRQQGEVLEKMSADRAELAREWSELRAQEQALAGERRSLLEEQERFESGRVSKQEEEEGLSVQRAQLQQELDAFHVVRSQLVEREQTLSALEAAFEERRQQLALGYSGLEEQQLALRDRENFLRAEAERMSSFEAEVAVREAKLVDREEVLEFERGEIQLEREDLANKTTALSADAARPSGLDTQDQTAEFEALRAALLEAQRETEHLRARFEEDLADAGARKQALDRARAEVAEELQNLRQQSTRLESIEQQYVAERDSLVAERSRLGESSMRVANGSGTGQGKESLPEAHLQALQHARRQLRDLKQELRVVEEDSTRSREFIKGVQARLERQQRALVVVDTLYSGGSEDADTMMHGMLRVLAECLGAAEASFWEADPENSRYRCVCAANVESEGEIRHEDLPRSRFEILFLSFEAEPLLAVKDLRQDPRTKLLCSLHPGLGSAGSMLFVPVCHPDQPRGLLVFSRKDASVPWEEDEKSFALACSHLAGHVLRSRSDALNQRISLQAKMYDRDLLEFASGGEDEEGLGDAPLYRGMIESAGCIVWALNSEGRITFVNPAAEAAYGYAATEMLGRSIAEFCRPGSGKADLEALRLMSDDLPFYAYQTEHVREDGRPMVLSVTLAPLQDGAGESVGTVGVAFDRTKFHQKEAGARKVDASYRDLVENLPDLVWSVDTIGRITFVSEAVRRIYGFAPEELLGRPLTMLADEKQGRADLERLSVLLETEECAGYTTKHIRKDGRTVALFILARVRRDSDGRVTGAVGFAAEVPDASPALHAQGR